MLQHFTHPFGITNVADFERPPFHEIYVTTRKIVVRDRLQPLRRNRFADVAANITRAAGDENVQSLFAKLRELQHRLEFGLVHSLFSERVNVWYLYRNLIVCRRQRHRRWSRQCDCNRNATGGHEPIRLGPKRYFCRGHGIEQRKHSFAARVPLTTGSPSPASFRTPTGDFGLMCQTSAAR